MASKYYFTDDPLDKQRHLSFLRSQAQARFRGELWQLTYEDYCEFWNESTFPLRGRSPECLCLCRYDPTGPWSKSNTVQITRANHLQIKNRRQWDIPAEEFFKGARWLNSV